MAQKSSSGDHLHRIKTEKRATETWGYQILPTLYSTYQKVPDIFQECAVLCFAFASISMHLNLFGKSVLVRTFCHFILNWAKFCMHLILFFFFFESMPMSSIYINSKFSGKLVALWSTMYISHKVILPQTAINCML